MNLEEYLKTVGDYADQVAAAERQAEQRSMDVARAMDEVYESKVWVAEWLEQKPEPKRPTARWNPEDRNRFIAWQAWKLEQGGRRTLSRPRSWTLLEGATVSKICSAGTNLAAVEPVRPLFWMRKNRYESRLPEVWALAVQLAGGDPSRVTSAHTREALAQWKKQTFGTRRDGTPRKTPSAVNQAAAAAGKANQLRRHILDEMAEMVRLAGLNEKAHDEWAALLNDIDHLLDENEAAAAAQAVA